MGLLTGVVVGGIVIIGGSLLVGGAGKKRSSDNLSTLRPYTSRWLLGNAVRNLPEEMQERYAEEWAAHLDEIPDRAEKWSESAGFNLAVFRAPIAARRQVIASLYAGLTPFGIGLRARRLVGNAGLDRERARLLALALLLAVGVVLLIAAWFLRGAT